VGILALMSRPVEASGWSGDRKRSWSFAFESHCRRKMFLAPGLGEIDKAVRTKKHEEDQWWNLGDWGKGQRLRREQPVGMSFCFLFLIFFIHMCIQCLGFGSFLPHSPYPSLSPPPPYYQLETILPLFLILL
jgi:hypothetical protein